MSKFAHLVSAFTKERLTGKIENGFFLTVKETLVVGLAQRAIICIFLTDSQKLVSVYKVSIRLVPPIIDDKDIQGVPKKITLLKFILGPVRTS